VSGASSRSRLTADDWAQAALVAFAEGGLAAVAVEPLALRLGATKGSFYWHFANRDALVVAALQLWELRRTQAVIDRVGAREGPRARLETLLHTVIEQSAGDPLEAQILAAADHPLVADAARRVVGRRTTYLIDLFEQLGFDRRAAATRAVLLYAAYAGHDQLRTRLPDVLPMTEAGGTGEYLDALLDLVLAGVGRPSG